MDDWLALGRLGRPHGVRGAIRFWPFNAATELVQRGVSLKIGKSAADARLLTIDDARCDAKGWVIRLDGVEDRDAAEALNGLSGFTRRDALPAPADDECYLIDLIGKPVVTRSGVSLGQLSDFEEGPGGQLLVVRGPGGTHRIPNVDAFVERLDPALPAIIIRPIPGLIDGLDETE